MSQSSNFIPNAMSDLPTWLNYLESIHPKTIDLGLNRVQKVGAQLDVLKPAPFIFTVAGTNGKGTTCRTLELILLEAGYKVGVYSSPHILNYTERVRINNCLLPGSSHVQSFNAIETNRGETALTYFEYSTLSALWLFKQAKLDIVILEVGLGGRLDATNIVDADIAIITTIALDHTDYLGDTRESIGYEKAGILKPNCITIVGEPDCPKTIYQVAKEKHVQLHLCKPNPNGDWAYQDNNNGTWNLQTNKKCYESLPVPNVPLANSATALTALTYTKFNIDKNIIKNALNKTSLTGRFQIIKQNPLTIIDAAHNPHAAIYLNKRIQKIRNERNLQKIHIVIGMLKDKDIQTTVKSLNGDVWYCATLYGERGASSQMIADCIDSSLPNVIYQFEQVSDAWQKAINNANPNDIIIGCGSFHTIAEILTVAEDE
ncbi:bifunctional tetrahydrofolate synthase/dihydrofolate synthase [Orbaceae bacterium ac157xtp]